MQLETLKSLDEAVRKARGDTSSAQVEAMIKGHTVVARVDRAMINRGMATGTADRWTYKCDGKVISAANLGKLCGGW